MFKSTLSVCSLSNHVHSDSAAENHCAVLSAGLLMLSRVALDAGGIWFKLAGLVSLYERLYEPVAALLTKNDGEALNGAIDGTATRLQSAKTNTSIIVKGLPVKHGSEKHFCGRSLGDL